MKKRLSSRGFTLPEILIASLITIILLGAVGSVFLTSLNLFSRGADIANKSGTITNVETNLQNKLAVTSEVEIATSPSGPYSIGFNSDEICQEIIKKDGEEDIKYTIDQLSEIILKVDGNMLKYELEAKDGMSTLKGGIILNNIDDVSSQEGFAENFEVDTEAGTKEIQLKPEKSLYLLIK